MKGDTIMINKCESGINYLTVGMLLYILESENGKLEKYNYFVENGIVYFELLKN